MGLEPQRKDSKTFGTIVYGLTHPKVCIHNTYSKENLVKLERAEIYTFKVVRRWCLSSLYVSSIGQELRPAILPNTYIHSMYLTLVWLPSEKKWFHFWSYSTRYFVPPPYRIHILQRQIKLSWIDFVSVFTFFNGYRSS